MPEPTDIQNDQSFELSGDFNGFDWDSVKKLKTNPDTGVMEVQAPDVAPGSLDWGTSTAIGFAPDTTKNLSEKVIGEVLNQADEHDKQKKLQGVMDVENLVDSLRTTYGPDGKPINKIQAKVPEAPMSGEQRIAAEEKAMRDQIYNQETESAIKPQEDSWSNRFRTWMAEDKDAWVLGPEMAQNFSSIRSYWNYTKVLAEMLPDVPAVLMGAPALTWEGGGHRVDSASLNGVIDRSFTIQEKWSEKYGKMGDLFGKVGPLPGFHIQDLTGAPMNVGFNLSSAVAAVIPASIAAFINPVASWLVGSAAGGYAAYRGTQASTFRDTLKVANEFAVKKYGTPLNQNEVEVLHSRYDTYSRRMGLWEGALETVATAAEMSILKMVPGAALIPGSQGAVKEAVKETTGALKTLLKKNLPEFVGTLLKITTVEQITETATNTGQAMEEYNAGFTNAVPNMSDIVKKNFWSVVTGALSSGAGLKLSKLGIDKLAFTKKAKDVEVDDTGAPAVVDPNVDKEKVTVTKETIECLEDEAAELGVHDGEDYVDEVSLEDDEEAPKVTAADTLATLSETAATGKPQQDVAYAAAKAAANFQTAPIPASQPPLKPLKLLNRPQATEIAPPEVSDIGIPKLKITKYAQDLKQQVEDVAVRVDSLARRASVQQIRVEKIKQRIMKATVNERYDEISGLQVKLLEAKDKSQQLTDYWNQETQKHEDLYFQLFDLVEAREQGTEKSFASGVDDSIQFTARIKELNTLETKAADEQLKRFKEGVREGSRFSLAYAGAAQKYLSRFVNKSSIPVQDKVRLLNMIQSIQTEKQMEVNEPKLRAALSEMRKKNILAVTVKNVERLVDKNPNVKLSGKNRNKKTVDVETQEIVKAVRSAVKLNQTEAINSMPETIAEMLKNPDNVAAAWKYQALTLVAKRSDVVSSLKFNQEFEDLVTKGRAQLQAKLKARKDSLEATAAKVVDTIITNHPIEFGGLPTAQVLKNSANTPNYIKEEQKKAKEKTETGLFGGRTAAERRATYVNFDFIARKLDGWDNPMGAMYQAYVKPMRQMVANEYDRGNKITEKMNEIMLHLDTQILNERKHEFGSSSASYMAELLPFLRREFMDRSTVFTDGTHSAKLTKGQQMTMYGLSQNATQYQTLVSPDAWGFSDEIVKKAIANLSESEKQVVDRIREELFKPLFAEALVVKKNVFNMAPKSEEMYWPMHVIRSYAQFNTEKDVFMAMAGVASTLEIDAHSMTDRTGSARAVDLNFFDVVFGHTNELNHMISFSEGIRDINALVQNAQFREAALKVITKEDLKFALEKPIQDAAVPNPPMAFGDSRIMRWFRDTKSAMIMGAKYSTFITQFTGVFVVAERTGKSNVVQAIRDLWKDFRSGGELTQMISDNVPGYRKRCGDYVAFITAAVPFNENSTKALAGSKYLAARNWIGQMGRTMLVTADLYNCRIAALSAYYAAQRSDNINVASDPWGYAESVMLQTQADMDKYGAPEVFKGNEFSKMIYNLGSFINAVYMMHRTVKETAQYHADVRSMQAGDMGALARLENQLVKHLEYVPFAMAAFIFPTMFRMAVLKPGKMDEPLEWVKELVSARALTPFAQMAASAVFKDQTRVTPSVATSGIEDMIGLFVGAKELLVDHEISAKTIANALGFIFKLPSSQGLVSWDGLEAMLDGDTYNVLALFQGGENSQIDWF